MAPRKRKRHKKPKLEFDKQWMLRPPTRQIYGSCWAVAIANALTVKFNTDYKFDTDISSQELLDNCTTVGDGIIWVIKKGIHSDRYYRRYIGRSHNSIYQLGAAIVPRFQIQGCDALMRNKSGNWIQASFDASGGISADRVCDNPKQWIVDNLKQTPLICGIDFDKMRTTELVNLHNVSDPNYVLKPSGGETINSHAVIIFGCCLNSSANPSQQILHAQDSSGVKFNGGGNFKIQLNAVTILCAPKYLPQNETITHTRRRTQDEAVSRES